MKRVMLLIMIGTMAACNEPLGVTGKTDAQQTTSGTMGSVRANNQMPDRTIDSPGRNIPDTLGRRHEK